MKKSIQLFLFLAIGASAFFAAPSAHALQFGLPIQCTVGKDCYIQKYVDHDVTEGAYDYQCNAFMTNDAHTGTDFRLPNFKDLDKKVSVVAAADGVVKAVRNGLADKPVITNDDKMSVMKVGYGNVVIIDHAEGYQTVYAHMKDGSLTVTEGQDVKKGEKLGEVGISGLTEFPHVHFEVRKDSQAVDPFTGAVAAGKCPVDTAGQLWDEQSFAAIKDYSPTRILGFGFSNVKPASIRASMGEYEQEEMQPNSPMFIFWGNVMAPYKGDKILMTLKDPKGVVLATSDKQFERGQAQHFMYVGKKIGAAIWPDGEYQGTIILEREGKPLFTESKVIRVVNPYKPS